MLVFMEDHFKRITAADLGGKGDIVAVGRGEEIAGDVIPGLAFILRLEGLERGVALKENDGSWDRRLNLRLREQQREYVTEFLEVGGQFSQVTFSRIPDDGEVL